MVRRAGPREVYLPEETEALGGRVDLQRRQLQHLPLHARPCAELLKPQGVWEGEEESFYTFDWGTHFRRRHRQNHA